MKKSIHFQLFYITCTLVIFFLLSRTVGGGTFSSRRLQWDHVNLRVLDYELIEIPQIPLGRSQRELINFASQNNTVSFWLFAFEQLLKRACKLWRVRNESLCKPRHPPTMAFLEFCGAEYAQNLHFAADASSCCKNSVALHSPRGHSAKS